MAPAPENVTFEQIDAYLVGVCSTSTACHGAGAREIVLRDGGTYDKLLEFTVERCDDQLLVVPNDPSASALYNLITGGCGNFRMPPACQSNMCTGIDNVRMVESWILDGAPE
jgi:hypothetical protein